MLDHTLDERVALANRAQVIATLSESKWQWSDSRAKALTKRFSEQWTSADEAGREVGKRGLIRIPRSG